MKKQNAQNKQKMAKILHNLQLTLSFPNYLPLVQKIWNGHPKLLLPCLCKIWKKNLFIGYYGNNVMLLHGNIGKISIIHSKNFTQNIQNSFQFFLVCC